MAVSSIRRRLRNLEALEMFNKPVEYPPFTGEEIQAIASRIVEYGDNFTREEVARMHQHTRLEHGECLITAYNGNVRMNRYGGLNVLVDI